MKVRAYKRQRVMQFMALYGSSLRETIYLLSSRANRQHLLEAIAQDKAGNKQVRQLLSVD